jgi:hypothetical protein
VVTGKEPAKLVIVEKDPVRDTIGRSEGERRGFEFPAGRGVNMRLDKLISLAFIALLLYLGYSYGMPYLKERMEGGGGGSNVTGMGDGAMCIRRVQKAGLDLRKRTRSFEGPEVDLAKFAGAIDVIESQVKQAERECACNGSACRAGRESLVVLKEAVANYERRVKKGDYRPLDLRSFDSMVKEAAVIARSENPL